MQGLPDSIFEGEEKYTGTKEVLDFSRPSHEIDPIRLKRDPIPGLSDQTPRQMAGVVSRVFVAAAIAAVAVLGLGRLDRAEREAGAKTLHAQDVGKGDKKSVRPAARIVPVKTL